MDDLTQTVNAFLSLPHEDKLAFVSRVNESWRAEDEGTVTLRELKFRSEDRKSFIFKVEDHPLPMPADKIETADDLPSDAKALPFVQCLRRHYGPSIEVQTCSGTDGSEWALVTFTGEPSSAQAA